ncbi:MAG TPA: hypothetical protein DDX39_03510 [Bacteroidales bacterium]|nr:MAG: hypothetical protein A2W98_12810 [Bacteroidetes bacterium GWF2_33_38]OFY75225.1 MAG: hypothetical protein A2265_11300 [Bacteroidetes bacterium RIFOXYA12_FULL_33_9]OFY91914.1 MAG: hypothetical protein A2236_13510 [Bacteroidetes bacterium RIFOXYA2_FULL_33_7]HBF87687.1 hypothetical protein [Bacteroidales bacterium]
MLRRVGITIYIIAIFSNNLFSTATIKKFNHTGCIGDCKYGIIENIRKNENISISIGVHCVCCTSFNPFCYENNDTLYVGFNTYGLACRCDCNYVLYYKIDGVNAKNIKYVEKTDVHPEWKYSKSNRETMCLLKYWGAVDRKRINNKLHKLGEYTTDEKDYVKFLLDEIGSPMKKDILESFKKYRKKHRYLFIKYDNKIEYRPTRRNEKDIKDIDFDLILTIYPPKEEEKLNKMKN